MNSIFRILNLDNTIAINRHLAHAIGLQESVFYQALLAKCDYYEKRGQLDAGGYFYCTSEDMEESTTLSRRAQDRVVARLIQLKLISYCRKGMPAKRFFAINQDTSVLLEILEQQEKSDVTSEETETEQKADEGTEECAEPSGNGQIADDSAVCTKRTNKIVRNDQTRLYETYKQDCTERSNKFVRNVQENIKDKTRGIKQKEGKKDLYARRETYEELIRGRTDNPELQEALLEYVRMRELKKNTMTNTAFSLLIDDLFGLTSDPAEQKAIVLQSVKNGWPSFSRLRRPDYEEKPQKKGRFNDFEQNTYDFAALEKDILKNG